MRDTTANGSTVKDGNEQINFGRTPISGLLPFIRQEGITDDRLHMARIRYGEAQVELVFSDGTPQPGISRHSVSGTSSEISSCVRVGALRFLEMAADEYVPNRARLAKTVNALMQMKSPDGAPTRGVYFASTVGRAAPKQFLVQSPGKFSLIDGIRSIRYDHRTETLFGIRVVEGDVGVEIVTLGGTATQRADDILESSEWTTLTGVERGNVVSLSKPRVRDGEVTFIANLQRNAYRQLTIATSGGRLTPSWGPEVQLDHLVIGALPGKRTLVAGCDAHQRETELAIIVPDGKNKLAAFAS